MTLDELQQLSGYILAKAQERAAELYNPGTYTLRTDRAELKRTPYTHGRSSFKWRFDVMIPVRPNAMGQRLSVVQAGMYRKDVWGQIQLRKGDIGDDPVVGEGTLMLFWTTLYVAFDREVWHTPEDNVWQQVGRVPPEIPM